MKDTIEAEDAKAALMKDKYGIAAIFRKYANANFYDPDVRDNILEYFIERIYVYDDRLIIQTDLVDYVGDCRHEAPWAFGDYDVGFARELEFDYFAFSSTTHAACRTPLVEAGPTSDLPVLPARDWDM